MRAMIAVSVILSSSAFSQVTPQQDPSQRLNQAVQLAAEGSHEKAIALLNPNESLLMGAQLAGKSQHAVASLYLRSAAERGLKLAQVAYAYLLANSEPPTRNLVEAYAWAHLNAEGIDENASSARRIRDRVASSITAEDLRRAESRAVELKELAHKAPPIQK